jgi:hypothetical protein
MKEYRFKNVHIDQYYQIKDDVESLMLQMKHDKLSENYTTENFFKDGPVFISIIYKNNQPFEVSTIISRDMFQGGCRVLNRLMVSPLLRERSTSPCIPETTLTMLASQIEFAKEHFNFAFISRQYNTHRFCKRFAKDANNFLDSTWKYETDRYLVCNDPKPNSTCWQNIAWTKFKDLDNFPLQSQSSYH